MSTYRSRTSSAIRAFLVIAVLGGIAPGTTLADDGNANKNSELIGTWHAVIRYPGFPNDYFMLMAFNPGGTATMVFVDGPRTSVSLGVWKQLRGWGNFAVSYDGLFDADSDGSFDRRFRDRLTLHLLNDDTFTGTAASDALTLDGSTLLGPPLQGIALQGTRAKVVRE